LVRLRIIDIYLHNADSASSLLSSSSSSSVRGVQQQGSLTDRQNPPLCNSHERPRRLGEREETPSGFLCDIPRMSGAIRLCSDLAIYPRSSSLRAIRSLHGFRLSVSLSTRPAALADRGDIHLEPERWLDQSAARDSHCPPISTGSVLRVSLGHRSSLRPG
jgi:hypothetical protein